MILKITSKAHIVLAKIKEDHPNWKQTLFVG